MTFGTFDFGNNPQFKIEGKEKESYLILLLDLIIGFTFCFFSFFACASFLFWHDISILIIRDFVYKVQGTGVQPGRTRMEEKVRGNKESTIEHHKKESQVTTWSHRPYWPLKDYG